MVSISNNRYETLPVSTTPVLVGNTPTNRNQKLIDILRQLEYLRKQIKQLLDT